MQTRKGNLSPPSTLQCRSFLCFKHQDNNSCPVTLLLRKNYATGFHEGTQPVSLRETPPDFPGTIRLQQHTAGFEVDTVAILTVQFGMMCEGN